MMKFCSSLTQKYGIRTDVSLNTIMVDGTGMCGACRVSVGGKTKFVCVDGPEFDGHQVDWDEMMKRMGAFREIELEEMKKLEASLSGTAGTAAGQNAGKSIGQSTEASAAQDTGQTAGTETAKAAGDDTESIDVLCDRNAEWPMNCAVQ